MDAASTLAGIRRGRARPSTTVEAFSVSLRLGVK
jgi:hypothetical protein